MDFLKTCKQVTRLCCPAGFYLTGDSTRLGSCEMAGEDVREGDIDLPLVISNARGEDMLKAEITSYIG